MHFIRKQVQAKTLSIQHVLTKHQRANIFTKLSQYQSLKVLDKG